MEQCPLYKIACIFACLSLFLLLGSCEGYNCASGIVQDDTNRSPLDSVLAEVISDMGSVYTDSNGKFKACNRMASCVPRCKDITVRFSKNGYRQTTLTNPEPGNVILLHR